ncbi:MAG TPA: DUF5060 domain-containing protein [Bryobacteraceae bacterium]|nr:DUF5060 domain-containing protein [Bryobacteraceae bacterium]
MHPSGRLLALTVVSGALPMLAAQLPGCLEGAKSFLPCELSFDWRANEVPANTSPYKEDLLSVEFRSPNHVTYLMHAFAEGSHSLKVRFSPTEAGQWTYRISSSVKRLERQEATFNVADSGLPGFVGVANLRHWWTTNKQPHLWLSVAVPWFEMDQPTFESWLDARKQDGFTHVRGTLLTGSGRMKPLTADMLPNAGYFDALDDRLLAADARGFTLDLVIADDSFLRSGAFRDWDQRGALVRYMVARYGGLNVTWQGIEQYESIPDSRALLKDMGAALEKYDSYRHPRSTEARTSSSPLVADGWMNYLIESVENPQFGAVEHQFTTQPEIHEVNAKDPDAFRHQLWSCTTNGEYPSISFDSLREEANIRAVRTWVKVVSETRHWEFEPYFDVDGARAVGLAEIGYIAYAQNPGIVEINFDRHKYTPIWINPSTGEETEEKNWRGNIFSRPTPDNSHDWILDIEREGHKESMLKSVRFESIDPPVQEIEIDSEKIPFDVAQPASEQIDAKQPVAFKVKLTRTNRATRTMQYVWWGEVVATGLGSQLLAVGADTNFKFPPEMLKEPGATISLRVDAINANGKAYELNKVYTLNP